VIQLNRELAATITLVNKMIKRKSILLRFGLVLLFCLTGLQPSVSAQSQTASRQIEREQQNKALVRRWIDEGFNKKDLRVVDEIFAETLSINGAVIGRENLRQSMKLRFAAFPDLHVTIEEIIGEGDKVGIWYTARGTHKGEFGGISPTGRQVNWFGFDLLRFEGSKIAQARFIDDSLGLMRQLGATLSPPPTQK
jgi:predicted ester cyclase